MKNAAAAIAATDLIFFLHMIPLAKHAKDYYHEDGMVCEHPYLEDQIFLMISTNFPAKFSRVLILCYQTTR